MNASKIAAPKKITVILTGRAPVKVDPAVWGTIAQAKWHSGQHEVQASETAYLRVRQHDDGRTLVYGGRGSGPGGMPLGYEGTDGGVLLTPDASGVVPNKAIATAIAEVGTEIGAPESLIRNCVADLPAEEI